MAKSVFILGAGGSKQAGAPLMSEFLDRAHDLWKLGLVEDSSEDFKRVFEAISLLTRVHSKAKLDIKNIESVFSALEMARILRAFPDRDSAYIQRSIASIRRLIVRTLELSIRFPFSEGGMKAPTPYPHFARLIRRLQSSASPKHSVAVLTFNYDLCADVCILNEGLQIDYGLGAAATESLPLLKLHGSLHWNAVENSDEIFQWPLPSFYPAKHELMDDALWCWFPVATRVRDRKVTGKALSGEPLLVPPTWNKQDAHRALTNVWARAARELGEAENIFVVGYSLPSSDAFFQYLYALGTSGSELIRRFWVFNPDDSGQAQARFECLLGHGIEGRFKYWPLTFGQCLSEIENEFGVASVTRRPPATAV